MSQLKEKYRDIFNLDKRKEKYTGTQILGIAAIVLFLFPIIFNIFGFLSLPIAYSIEFIFKPRTPKGLYIAILTVSILKIAMGLVSGIWISKLVWPKRKLIEEVEEEIPGEPKAAGDMKTQKKG